MNTNQRHSLRDAARRARGVVWAILRHRCPRCQEGRLFRGLFVMNDPCPVCGLLFKREEGTFLGAMYVSYVLGAALMAAIYFPLAAALPSLNGLAVAALSAAAFLPFTPILFRYSRTIWIHFERAGSPGGQSATAYEKARLRELARRPEGRPSEGQPPPPSGGGASAPS